MFKTLLYVSVITSSIVLTACSPAEEKTTKENPGTEHFASDQKRALDKAKGVEQMLQDSADKRAQEIDNQTK